ARAVHPVRGPDHLVVAPPVAVEGVTGPPALAEDRAAVRRLLPAGEELPDLEQGVGRGAIGARRNGAGNHGANLSNSASRIRICSWTNERLFSGQEFMTHQFRNSLSVNHSVSLVFSVGQGTRS